MRYKLISFSITYKKLILSPSEKNRFITAEDSSDRALFVPFFFDDGLVELQQRQ